ncbi:MAG: hypothetical protein P9X24_12395 [Candidatus Hatepunaea meridiana]|nr:hypothetical protein [Candidatus Hatepunaea meridiana]
MLKKFYGKTLFQRDTKGRFQIPSMFRDQIQRVRPDYMVMTRGIGKSIYLFLPDIFDEFLNRIDNMSVSPMIRAQLNQSVVWSAANCTIDMQWRIRIPDDLAKMAGITTEVEILGGNKWIELWHTDRRQQFIKKMSFDFDEAAWDLYYGVDAQSDEKIEQDDTLNNSQGKESCQEE